MLLPRFRIAKKTSFHLPNHFYNISQSVVRCYDGNENRPLATNELITVRLQSYKVLIEIAR